jgi:hypothetical protein
MRTAKVPRSVGRKALTTRGAAAWANWIIPATLCTVFVTIRAPQHIAVSPAHGMARMRILIAGIEESNPRLAAIFHDCDATFVDTMAEAQVALAQPYDVLLIAVRFDESRMFDLLRYLKSHGTLSRLPVICYRSSRRSLIATPLARQGVQLASCALGASDFVDLVADRDTERANQRFREAVFRAVESVRSR